MAEGLAAAHEAGLVHRDVKPGNVWLAAPGGRVRLLDFGLARLAEGDARMTRTGALLGTPAYMSPEQAAGNKDVDGRADLFSLGAVLYEMLTGRRAFQGDSWMAVLANRLHTRPAPPHEVNAAVPEEVSSLVMRLLAEKPADRPSSARQVARRLKALEAPPAESLHTTRRPRGTGRRRRWWVAAVAVVFLAGGGLAFGPWWGERSPPGPGPGGPPPTEMTAARFAPAAFNFCDALHGGAQEAASRARQGRQFRQAALSFGDAFSEDASEGLARTRHDRSLRGAASFGGRFVEATREGLLRARDDRLAEQERRLQQREAGAAALAFTATLSEAATADLARRPAALYARGMRLLRGRGAERDPRAAVALLRLAAEGGHAPAQYQMALLAESGSDVLAVDGGEALRGWRRAAAQGYAPAQAELAAAHWLGRYGVAKDEREAERLGRAALPALRRAAEEGDDDAAYALAELLADGIGVARDDAGPSASSARPPNRATPGRRPGWDTCTSMGVGWRRTPPKGRLYRLAAERGFAAAQINLAWLYVQGLGVAQDQAVAAGWYRRAAEQGHPYAQNRLGSMLSEGRGLAKDEAAALGWYRKAAEQGHSGAQWNLALMYKNGDGVAKDLDEAARWLRQVVGNPEASEKEKKDARDALQRLGR
jgi:TPR repeat protein